MGKARIFGRARLRAVIRNNVGLAVPLLSDRAADTAHRVNPAVGRLPEILSGAAAGWAESVGAGGEDGGVTTAVLDSEQARIEGLLESLRAAEAEYRRGYARVLDLVAEVDAAKVGAAAGFGTTARLLAGVLNLSQGEARIRVEHAELLTARRSLTGEVVAPVLPATAAELVAGACHDSCVSHG